MLVNEPAVVDVQAQGAGRPRRNVNPPTHLQDYVVGDDIDERRPVTIFEDNQGALALAKNPVHHERSKHIDIRYHFTRECVLNKQIEIAYVQSENNVADIMTKAATKLKLSKFHAALFGSR